MGLEKDLPIVKIPWGHNVLLLEKVKDFQERLWYAEQTIEHGLSRVALEDWIKSKAYKRHGKAITNFAQQLPEPQSKLAQETLKDPYNFDFLTLDSDFRELELENNDLGPEGIEFLMTLPFLANLTNLDLSENQLWPDGAVALAQAQRRVDQFTHFRDTRH